MSLLAKVRLLVVDDDQDLLETYVLLLTNLGFTVSSAANGKIAWELMQTQDFDIVFTDIKMPVMTGVDLLKKIRQRDPSSPSVMLTSGYSDFANDVLFSLGANGFLAKPVGALSIREALNRSLLQKEHLWAQPAAFNVVSTVAKRFSSFEEMIDGGEVRFGNGGFYIRQTVPGAAAQSYIKFTLTFDDQESFPKIEGSGLIQWVHLMDSEGRGKGLGIEIKFLQPACRAALCAWLKEQKIAAFIPMV